jgi:hypothetical protein
MTVQAKFYVVGVTPGIQASEATVPATHVRLEAVTTGDGNQDWAKYTPSGHIQMVINNPEAAAQFQPGQRMLINFTPVEE